MHAKRWITGIIAFPLLVGLIFKGGPAAFALLIAAVAVLAFWEYLRIVLPPLRSSYARIIPLLGLALAPALVWGAYSRSWSLMLGVIVGNLLIAALISLPCFKSDPLVGETVIKQGLGMIYLPLLLSYLVLIRNGADGAAWIFVTLCVVFAGDTGAFYVGTYMGQHKLCPAVSPKKTIEGSLGGLLSNLFVGLLLKVFFLAHLPWGRCALLFLAIGIAGQVGDLFESELKRTANIKDSGRLLPGHGGVLDRIDALLFAAPVVYYFKEFLLS